MWASDGYKKFKKSIIAAINGLQEQYLQLDATGVPSPLMDHAHTIYDEMTNAQQAYDDARSRRQQDDAARRERDTTAQQAMGMPTANSIVRGVNAPPRLSFPLTAGQQQALAELGQNTNSPRNGMYCILFHQFITIYITDSFFIFQVMLSMLCKVQLPLMGLEMVITQ